MAGRNTFVLLVPWKATQLNYSFLHIGSQCFPVIAASPNMMVTGRFFSDPRWNGDATKLSLQSEPYFTWTLCRMGLFNTSIITWAQSTNKKNHSVIGGSSPWWRCPWSLGDHWKSVVQQQLRSYSQLGLATLHFYKQCPHDVMLPFSPTCVTLTVLVPGMLLKEEWVCHRLFYD